MIRDLLTNIGCVVTKEIRPKKDNQITFDNPETYDVYNIMKGTFNYKFHDWCDNKWYISRSGLNNSNVYWPHEVFSEKEFIEYININFIPDHRDKIIDNL